MKFAFLAAALAALTSAALAPAGPVRLTEGEMGADGYVFQHKAFSRLGLTIRVHEYRSRTALVAAHPDPPPGLLGFSTWNDAGCEIHVLDPSVRYEPEVIGHELVHCLHGDFHPSQESAR